MSGALVSGVAVGRPSGKTVVTPPDLAGVLRGVGLKSNPAAVGVALATGVAPPAPSAAPLILSGVSVVVPDNGFGFVLATGDSGS